MSELTKEKIYKSELIKAGATGNNNLERIRSLAGGGGGTQALDDLLTGQLTTLESNVSGEIVGLYGDNVTTISLPNATIIDEYAFSDLHSLTTVSLPSATNIGNAAFNMDTALTTVSLPSATNIGNAAFYTCEALTTLSLPSATNIENDVFDTCRSLTSLTLGANQVCTIGIDVFNEIPNKVTVYVPSNLIEQYKVATNWADYYTNNKVDFVAITE